ncbi:hypothetical protein [Marinobacter salsuginis]|jgi:hypothetical protein|uniref:Uncharacterized protein n=1 Tax=Marinobacter salsuginis TaxID=418719 RepID=A0A5M3Q5B3_9GAMM|nr:hypothetical protein [Marinobacter salsuginis]GBO90174.1 hypothetical protein MSSD14B_38420 [Marinobacter salsuginis]
MSEMPYDVARPGSNRTRELSLTDAKRFFLELAQATWSPDLDTCADYEDLTQHLLYIISSYQENKHSLAKELFLWKNQQDFSITERLANLRAKVEELCPPDTEEGKALQKDIQALHSHLKLIQSEKNSFYHPSRYQLTYFENGIPVPLNPLRIIQVLEGKEGLVNLHINHNKRL